MSQTLYCYNIYQIFFVNRLKINKLKKRNTNPEVNLNFKMFISFHAIHYLPIYNKAKNQIHLIMKF